MSEPLLIDLIREWELHSNPKHHCWAVEGDGGLGVCPVQEFKFLGTFLAMNERPMPPDAVAFGHKMTERNRNWVDTDWDFDPDTGKDTVRVSDEQLSYFVGDYKPEPDIINRAVDRQEGKPKSVKELREAGRPIVDPDTLYHKHTDTPETHEDAPRLIAEPGVVEETMDYFKDRLDEIMSALNEVNERLERIENQDAAGNQFNIGQLLSDIYDGVSNIDRGFDK